MDQDPRWAEAPALLQVLASDDVSNFTVVTGYSSGRAVSRLRVLADQTRHPPVRREESGLHEVLVLAYLEHMEAYEPCRVMLALDVSAL